MRHTNDRTDLHLGQPPAALTIRSDGHSTPLAAPRDGKVKRLKRTSDERRAHAFAACSGRWSARATRPGLNVDVSCAGLTGNLRAACMRRGQASTWMVQLRAAGPVGITTSRRGRQDRLTGLASPLGDLNPHALWATDFKSGLSTDSSKRGDASLLDVGRSHDTDPGRILGRYRTTSCYCKALKKADFRRKAGISRSDMSTIP